MGIREETEQRVFAYMEELDMAVPGDRIVVGVSGGADSLCLLYVLLEYGKRVPMSLSVAHINHGIRPDAEEDARWVEELCLREGIPFFLTRADAAREARREGISLEDAGRRIRYEAFRQAAQRMGGGKIAVAHNCNDNAETMLFHLFRGSGLKGLCGILPVRGNIIRPLLCLERREVEAYLAEREILWRRDSTNDGDEYARNRIRHHILSYAEREIFPGAPERMGKTARMLAETEDYLEQQTLQALKQCLALEQRNEPEQSNEPEQYNEPEQNSGDMHGTARGESKPGEACRVLDVEAFLGFHPALQKRMLHTLIKQLSPTGKDICQVHIRDVRSLFLANGSRSISLPFGITARRQYGAVVLERGGDGTVRQFPPVEVPSWEEISDNSFVYDLGNRGKIEFSTVLEKKCREVPRNQYTKWFDYDKIEESLVIRSRQKGDYFTIRGGGGGIVHKSLKEYMVAEKIPRQMRERLPVVAAGKHILWLPGWRISEHFKVDGSTKRILQIRLLACLEV